MVMAIRRTPAPGAATNVLIWKRWDDSAHWLVFDPRSRQTHLLDELAAAVLRASLSHPVSEQGLADHLVEEFDMGADSKADAVKYVASVIPRLVELGLIHGSTL